MTRIPEELMAQYNNAEPIILSLDQIQSEIFQSSQQIVGQSDGYYALCSKQPKCSRVLEEALQFLYQEGSSHSIMLIKSVFHELTDNISELSEDSNASHVIQTLLILISRLSRDDPSLDKAYTQFLMSILELGNGKQLIQSPHAVQILKSLLLSESGMINTQKSKHQISNVIGGLVYGSQDKFFNKTSSHYTGIYQQIYNIVASIGIIQISKVPDTSSLLQLMIATNPNGWADPNHSWIQFLYELIACTDKQKQNMILNCIQHLIDKKALIWDNKFTFDQYMEQNKDYKFALAGEITYLSSIIRSHISENVYSFLDQFNQSQLFLFEKLLEQKQLQIICFCVLQNISLSDVLSNDQDKNNKYMHLLIKCINNVYFCPQILLKLLYDVQNNLELIFESQKDCYVISAVINSVNRIMLRAGHSDLEQIPQQINIAMNKALEDLIEKIASYVESGSFLLKKLLFPNIGVQDPIDLKSNSFSHNTKYEIQYLDILVDKDKVSEQEYKELMTKKRDEHKKIQQVKLELKYGNQRFVKQQDKDKITQIYGPGKEIIIKCIESSNDIVRNVFLTSFQTSFLEQSQSIIYSTIYQLIDCPATNDLIISIMTNLKIPLSIKLKILYSQKMKYNDLCKFKLGRLFIQATIKSLFTQVILNDTQYDISVNMSGICMVVEEVASKLSNIQLLKQSDEGKQIITNLGLERWLQDQDAWIKKTWAKLCKLGKQNNLICDESGFQKFNYLVAKQLHYQERKQQHKQRQQQINNSKKYYELRQKAKMQDIK